MLSGKYILDNGLLIAIAYFRITVILLDIKYA